MSRIRTIVAALGAGVDFVNRIAPPLQPDLAHHRLADILGHLRHFVIEGIERQKMRARIRRRDKAREIAVVIHSPNERFYGFAGVR